MIQLDEPKRELAYVIFSQKWKILVLTLICTLVAVYVSLFWPATYGSYGTLLVKSRKAEVNIETLQATDARVEPVRKEDLYSEISILTSNEVLRRALDRLQQEDMLGVEVVQQAWGLTEAQQLKQLRRNLSATVVPTSNVIDLELKGPDSEFTQRALAQILDQYIRFRLEVYSPERAADFLGGQLSYFREELEAKKGQLLSELEGSGVTLPDRQIDYNLQVQRELMTRRQDIETQAVQLRSLIDRLSKELLKPNVQFFSFVENNTIQDMSKNLQTLMADHHAKAHVFLSGHKEVAQSNDHIARAYATLKQEVRSYMLDKQSELAAMQRSILQLDSRIEELENKNLQIKRGTLKVEDIERDLALLRDSYETFFVRNEEALTASNPELAFLNSYVSILTPATAHDQKLFPRAAALIPLGVITGLILGLSLGFLYEYFDQTFKRPMEVEDVLGLPVIFSLNYKEELDENPDHGNDWGRVSVAAMLALLVGLVGWRIAQDTSAMQGLMNSFHNVQASLNQPADAQKPHPQTTLVETSVSAPVPLIDGQSGLLQGLAESGPADFSFDGKRVQTRYAGLGFNTGTWVDALHLQALSADFQLLRLSAVK